MVLAPEKRLVHHFLSRLFADHRVDRSSGEDAFREIHGPDEMDMLASDLRVIRLGSFVHGGYVLIG
jgi:hypothetical protein